MKLFSSLLFASLLFAPVAARAEVSETFTTTKALSKTGVVSVSNTNGGIKITGWDREEVELVAVKTASNERALAGIEIRISSTPDRFAVESRMPESSWWSWGRSGSVRYELRVPRTASIDEVESVNGSVELTDLAGKVRADTVNGAIRATNIGPDASLDTVNGSIRVVMASLREGSRAECETVNGSIVLSLPENACVDLRADTVNGSIRNDFGLPAPERKPGGGTFHGILGNGGSRVMASTVNGSIRFEKATSDSL